MQTPSAIIFSANIIFNFNTLVGTFIINKRIYSFSPTITAMGRLISTLARVEVSFKPHSKYNRRLLEDLGYILINNQKTLISKSKLYKII